MCCTQDVWTSADGTTWEPCEMSSDHIVNVLNYLIRRKQKELRAEALDEPDIFRARVLWRIAADVHALRRVVMHNVPVARSLERQLLNRNYRGKP